jgi:pyrroline-5-carboxylate reductase
MRIGLIGAGQMARALGKGFVSAGLVQAEDMVAADPVAAARAAFAELTGARGVEANADAVAQAEIVILAIKPQLVADACRSIRDRLTDAHLVLSIVAGVSLSRLADLLGPQPRLVRVMPNTPGLVGASASAWAPGPNLQPDDAATVTRLLEAVGMAVRVPESALDAVTGLAGSGPAWVLTLLEGMIDGGVLAGLPRDVARVLAVQTLLGTARLVQETGRHPSELKDGVTSPGGTTIHGLAVLESRGVRGAVMDAVLAATNRSKELGRSG